MSFSDFLLSLEDQDFFAVMRNYLGPLQTPFNKHDLIRRLQSFLTRRETVARIQGYLTPRDRELLAAVRYFGEPTERDLLFFFSESEGYLDLHNRLLNLQDRLIILADRQSHRLRINPILLDALDSAIDAEHLVPSRPVGNPRLPESWLTATLPAAFFAFLREFPELLKANGTFRKRAQEAAAEKFPLLFEEQPDEAEAAREIELTTALPYRVGLLLRGLVNLRVLRLETGVAEPSKEGFRRLADLRHRQLRLGLIAAARRSAWEGDGFYRTVSAAEDLLRQLAPEKGYDPVRLGRYFGLILAGHGLPREDGPGLLAAFTAAGVLRDSGDGYLAPALGEPRLQEEAERPQEEGAILLSPNFELTLPADTAIRTHLTVAEFGRILRYDRFCRYEITRHSFLAGCRGRREGEGRIAALKKLAGELPQNVETTLSAWVSEFGAFRLMEGVVLRVSGEQITIVEHAPAIQPYIREKLAEGVYLMAGAETEWRRALGEIGFEHVPPVERQKPTEGSAAFPFDEGPRDGATLPFTPGIETSGESDSANGEERQMEAVSEELRERIATLKAGEEVKQELQRRLELKLLLYPEQLENQAAQRAAAEARGLDYLGKLRIIEGALSGGGDLLEAVTRKAGGEPQRMLLRPRSLEKGSSDVILHGVALPDNRPVKVQVRKIALLRKLTGTLIRSL